MRLTSSLVVLVSGAVAWAPSRNTRLMTKGPSAERAIVSSSTRLHANLVDANSLIIAASDSSWRQYVPLVVSSMVLLDIVLGSPAANSVMRMAQQKVDDKESSNSESSEGNALQQPQLQQPQMRKNSSSSVSKPRIDVDAVVNQAMGKAENMQSLRAYLDDRKTDADRMRDIRRLQDQQMARLDRKNNNPNE